MQKKKDGISLIVLVITIIVMIVLAAAVVISLNNSGIIERANDAVKAYNQDELDHIASLAWSEAYLDGARTVSELTTGVRTGLTNAGLNPDDYGMIVTTTGVTITKGWLQDGLNIVKGNVTLEAGDLIQYNSGVQDYEGTWKVLGAEDGNLLILSTDYVGSLYLYGLEGNQDEDNWGHITDYGLINALTRLNEICTPFGNGIGAVGARSIKVEDANKLTGYDPTTYGVNQVYQYGNKVTYSWNSTTNGKVDYSCSNGLSGTLKLAHNDGFSFVDYNTMLKTTIQVNGAGLPTISCTEYSYDLTDTDQTMITINSSKASEMLFGDMNDDQKYYWFASLSNFITAGGLAYGIRYFAYNEIMSYNLYDSRGLEFADDTWEVDGVRAVVELSPNIIIGAKDNTLGWSYSI